jgi:hypothetical protein
MKGCQAHMREKAKESTTNNESYETSQKLRRQGKGCEGESLRILLWVCGEALVSACWVIRSKEPDSTAFPSFLES